MDYFFYGTLRDVDVRTRVLGRELRGATVEEAELPGYRAVFVSGATYPTLVPGKEARAPGLLVRGLGPRDAARLAAYEGDPYLVRHLTVQGGASGPVSARVFLTRTGVVATPRDWTLEAWRQRFKKRFMQRAQRGDLFRPS